MQNPNKLPSRPSSNAQDGAASSEQPPLKKPCLEAPSSHKQQQELSVDSRHREHDTLTLQQQDTPAWGAAAVAGGAASTLTAGQLQPPPRPPQAGLLGAGGVASAAWAAYKQQRAALIAAPDPSTAAPNRPSAPHGASTEGATPQASTPQATLLPAHEQTTFMHGSTSCGTGMHASSPTCGAPAGGAVDPTAAARHSGMLSAVLHSQQQQPPSSNSQRNMGSSTNPTAVAGAAARAGALSTPAAGQTAATATQLRSAQLSSAPQPPTAPEHVEAAFPASSRQTAAQFSQQEQAPAQSEEAAAAAEARSLNVGQLVLLFESQRNAPSSHIKAALRKWALLRVPHLRHLSQRDEAHKQVLVADLLPDISCYTDYMMQQVNTGSMKAGVGYSQAIMLLKCLAEHQQLLQLANPAVDYAQMLQQLAAGIKVLSAGRNQQQLKEQRREQRRQQQTQAASVVQQQQPRQSGQQPAGRTQDNAHGAGSSSGFKPAHDDGGMHPAPESHVAAPRAEDHTAGPPAPSGSEPVLAAAGLQPPSAAAAWAAYKQRKESMSAQQPNPSTGANNPTMTRPNLSAPQHDGPAMSLTAWAMQSMSEDVAADERACGMRSESVLQGKGQPKHTALHASDKPATAVVTTAAPGTLTHGSLATGQDQHTSMPASSSAAPAAVAAQASTSAPHAHAEEAAQHEDLAAPRLLTVVQLVEMLDSLPNAASMKTALYMWTGLRRRASSDTREVLVSDLLSDVTCLVNQLTIELGAGRLTVRAAQAYVSGLIQCLKEHQQLLQLCNPAVDYPWLLQQLAAVTGVLAAARGSAGASSQQIQQGQGSSDVAAAPVAAKAAPAATSTVLADGPAVPVLQHAQRAARSTTLQPQDQQPTQQKKAQAVLTSTAAGTGAGPTSVMHTLPGDENALAVGDDAGGSAAGSQRLTSSSKPSWVQGAHGPGQLLCAQQKPQKPRRRPPLGDLQNGMQGGQNALSPHGQHIRQQPQANSISTAGGKQTHEQQQQQDSSREPQRTAGDVPTMLLQQPTAADTAATPSRTVMMPAQPEYTYSPVLMREVAAAGQGAVRGMQAHDVAAVLPLEGALPSAPKGTHSYSCSNGRCVSFAVLRSRLLLQPAQSRAALHGLDLLWAIAGQLHGDTADPALVEVGPILLLWADPGTQAACRHSFETAAGPAQCLETLELLSGLQQLLAVPGLQQQLGWHLEPQRQHQWTRLCADIAGLHDACRQAYEVVQELLV